MDEKEGDVKLDGRIEEIEAELARITAFLDGLEAQDEHAAEYVRTVREKRAAQLRSLKDRRAKEH